ncbi:MAG: hypothetical protein Tsb0015_15880 [Simkaniaceae bacterium]
MLGIFLDTETNGLNIKHHSIIEIAIKILNLYSGKKQDQFHEIIFLPYEEWKKSDPESLKINGFSWAEISKGKKKAAVREEILEFFSRNQLQRGQSVFICQNPSFDRMFFADLIDMDLQEALQWPYHWLDLASMHWAVQIKEAQKKNAAALPWRIGISKNQISKWHAIPPENIPHRAMNGVDHLIACYQAVVGFLEKS